MFYLNFSSTNLSLHPVFSSTEAEPLAFLRSQPQFQQMRAVVQQNPDLLNAVLLQIGQTNPALLQLISQNQEAFVRMLNEPVSPGSAASRSGSESAGGNLGSDADDVANLAAALGNTAVQVTPQDKEAIERVRSHVNLTISNKTGIGHVS